MSYENNPNSRLRLRLQQLETFLSQHEGIIKVALEMYARDMRRVSDDTLEQYDEISADPKLTARQDKAMVTTAGLKSAAQLFADAADKAGRARAAMENLEDDE